MSIGEENRLQRKLKTRILDPGKYCELATVVKVRN